jgi:hypothetical protein
MQINITLMGGEHPRTFILSGRIGQTMHFLMKAKQVGITPLDVPAKRLAAYIHSLRGLGFIIDTEMEQHSGPYAGHHARYRLRSIVLRTETDKKAEV